jgi:hypothetical protein
MEELCLESAEQLLDRGAPMGEFEEALLRELRGSEENSEEDSDESFDRDMALINSSLDATLASFGD